MAGVSGDLNSSADDLSVGVHDRGRRANSLKEAIDITIQKYLDRIRFSMLKSNFKEIYDKDPASLKQIHSQLLNQLDEFIQLEVNKMYEDEDIKNLLNALDQTILENSETAENDAWRPSLNPSDDLRDHLYAVKVKHKEKLEETLRNLELQNKALLNTCQQNHLEILRNKALNESILHNFAKLPHLLESCSLQLEQKLLSLSSSEICISQDDEDFC